MKSVNSLINTIKNCISNNDSVKKIEEATNKILHKDDKECSCCNDTDYKNTENIDELNKIKIVQLPSSSIFNRSDDIYHLFRPQDNINSYDSSLIMRNVDKCKGTNENLKDSKRIQLYKNKGDISNFNTTIRTNLDKFKVDLSKDLRYKFLNKYGAKDDFNFDIYIFPPPAGVIPDGYSGGTLNVNDGTITYTRTVSRTVRSYSAPKAVQTNYTNPKYTVEGGTDVTTYRRESSMNPGTYTVTVYIEAKYLSRTYQNGKEYLIYNARNATYTITSQYDSKILYDYRWMKTPSWTYYAGSTSGP